MNKKHILRRKARKLWLRKIRSKEKKKYRRAAFVRVNRADRQRINYIKQHWDAKTVVAPRNFSFVSNTNDVAKFISKLSDCYDKDKEVFVVLRNIDILTYDALVVLLSIMMKFKVKKIKFNGDFPKNNKVRALLTSSGFFQYLFIDGFKEKDSYDLTTKNRIHTHAMKNVDSVLGANIIKDASKTIWGDIRRCQGVQKTFMELMQNTNNHADSNTKGVKLWWLSVFHVPEQKKVVFSFVDFGVGVFNSLEKKTERSKWYGVKQKMKLIFDIKNDAEMLKSILNGEMHRTVTNETYRGNGLPGLKIALNRNQISNLNIITNNVKADVKNDTYEIITQNFNGTFVYWELNGLNANCDGNA